MNLLIQCIFTALIWIREISSDVTIIGKQDKRQNQADVKYKKIPLNGKDDTVIISKLSETDLIKLLSVSTKNNNPYYLKMTKDPLLGYIHKYRNEHRNDRLENGRFYPTQHMKQKKYNYNNGYSYKNTHKSSTFNSHVESPTYRLENKKVAFDQVSPLMVNYLALQKLNKHLHDRSQSPLNPNWNVNNYNVNGMIYKLLIAQLKSLCCNRHALDSSKSDIQESHKMKKMKSNEIRNVEKYFSPLMSEQMFLVINDDITNDNTNEDLIYVDPNSLNRNSTILLLGQVKQNLDEKQLIDAMNRISDEISKPEYLQLLKKLSQGKLNGLKHDVLKNFFNSVQNRRYMKPHRCNHQSKLAKVYGGPKWIVCTGYLNLNTPSLYD